MPYDPAQPWICLTCNNRFALVSAFLKNRKQRDGIFCPACISGNTIKAVEVFEYLDRCHKVGKWKEKT